ncbi:hypothetical protein swp_0699 [Shewanella piezotolerans WP3]|uniref:Uncharacterized protein n=1 Tax=Shewanella piezotolerans (strain WP3 / JCM 13877) TaxID=225849 RepID=B8CIP0_SHEPW|nr:hypothetical protein swp_0699 [Shewanella piezotolerans WP3]
MLPNIHCSIPAWYYLLQSLIKINRQTAKNG